MNAKTITLDAHVARYVASALLPAVSRDDVTPILTGAHFSIEDGALRVASTDRYRVHTLKVGVNGKAPKELDAIVPRAALAWIVKNGGVFSRSRSPYSPVVRLRFTEKRVTISVLEHGEDAGEHGVDEVTFSTSLIDGRFPPVVRLVTIARDAEAEPVEGNLRTDYLASITAVSDGRRIAHIKFTKGDGAKLGPVYIRCGVAEAIIQPNEAEA